MPTTCGQCELCLTLNLPQCENPWGPKGKINPKKDPIYNLKKAGLPARAAAVRRGLINCFDTNFNTSETALREPVTAN